MPIHVFTYQPREAAADARQLLDRLADELADKPALQGKIMLARDLVTETEDVLADDGCEL